MSYNHVFRTVTLWNMFEPDICVFKTFEEARKDFQDFSESSVGDNSKCCIALMDNHTVLEMKVGGQYQKYDGGKVTNQEIIKFMSNLEWSKANDK